MSDNIKFKKDNESGSSQMSDNIKFKKDNESGSSQMSDNINDQLLFNVNIFNDR